MDEMEKAWVGISLAMAVVIVLRNKEFGFGKVPNWKVSEKKMTWLTVTMLLGKHLN